MQVDNCTGLMFALLFCFKVHQEKLIKAQLMGEILVRLRDDSGGGNYCDYWEMKKDENDDCGN